MSWMSRVLFKLMLALREQMREELDDENRGVTAVMETPSNARFQAGPKLLTYRCWMRTKTLPTSGFGWVGAGARSLAVEVVACSFETGEEDSERRNLRSSR